MPYCSKLDSYGKTVELRVPFRSRFPTEHVHKAIIYHTGKCTLVVMIPFGCAANTMPISFPL